MVQIYKRVAMHKAIRTFCKKIDETSMWMSLSSLCQYVGYFPKIVIATIADSVPINPPPFS